MTSAKSTQEFVNIKEIRDGIVILKNGGLRAIIIASSVNFSLKSKDEQEAMIFQYQNFVNSLDFHIQIFIQSRRLDIAPYINTLEERYKEQNNELLKVQTREYIEFIKNFTESTNIMTKSFFIVVPYSPSVVTNKESLFSKIPIIGNQTAKQQSDNFDEHKAQLEQRIGVVVQGLNRVGIRTQQLGTEELVELYFKIFNPGEKSAPTTV